jgi:hypothetical protein
MQVWEISRSFRRSSSSRSSSISCTVPCFYHLAMSFPRRGAAAPKLGGQPGTSKGSGGSSLKRFMNCSSSSISSTQRTRCGAALLLTATRRSCRSARAQRWAHAQRLEQHQSRTTRNAAILEAAPRVDAKPPYDAKPKTALKLYFSCSNFSLCFTRRRNASGKCRTCTSPPAAALVLLLLPPLVPLHP